MLGESYGKSSEHGIRFERTDMAMNAMSKEAYGPIKTPHSKAMTVLNADRKEEKARKRWKRFWHGLIVESLAAVGFLMVIGGWFSSDSLMPIQAKENLESPNTQVSSERSPYLGIAANSSTSAGREFDESAQANRATSRPLIRWISTLVHGL